VSAIRPLLASGLLLLSACAPALTPQQEWAMENFERCRTETKSWNASLDRVEPDGRMHVSAAQTPTDVNRVIDCMKARQEQQQGRPPAK
jgi:hypothetical protein